jgi:Protein of unknown function (DUF3500)
MLTTSYAFSRACTIIALLGAAATAVPAQSSTGRIVRAANAFLTTLDAAQRQRVLFAFTDEAQRARWSNFPTSFVRRAGLSLGELSATQRTAAMALVSSALSKRGLEKVQQMVEADEVLKVSERNNPMFGRDLYYISILGAPSETAPWMLQYGGHHLALNLTITGERGVLTPSLTAAQPAQYTVNGATVRPLGAENDKAFALINALTATQQAAAVLTYRVGDLVLGPGQDGKVIIPEGLKASGMTPAQRSMLLDVIGEWVGIVHETAAATRMAEIRAGLDDTWFAWSGPTSVEPGRNGSSYYRIQGPHLVIEYAPQRMGGDATMHVHTIYRDPTNDYGRPTAK